MISPDIDQSLPDDINQPGINLPVCFFHLLLSNLRRFSGQSDMVKLLRVFKECLILPAAHIFHNLSDRVLILGVLVRASLQKLAEQVVSGFLRQFDSSHDDPSFYTTWKCSAAR